MNVTHETTQAQTAPGDRERAYEFASRPPESEARRFEQLFARRDDDAMADDFERASLHAQLHPGVPTFVHEAAASQLAEPAIPAQLDDLIARYVQLLAVSDPSVSDPRVMLKLDASLLPDTELFLTKSAEGWVLQANARSPDAVRFIAEHGPALERRFREKRLGTLRIDTAPAR